MKYKNPIKKNKNNGRTSDDSTVKDASDNTDLLIFFDVSVFILSNLSSMHTSGDGPGCLFLYKEYICVSKRFLGERLFYFLLIWDKKCMGLLDVIKDLEERTSRTTTIEYI